MNFEENIINAISSGDLSNELKCIGISIASTPDILPIPTQSNHYYI